MTFQGNFHDTFTPPVFSSTATPTSLLLWSKSQIEKYSAQRMFLLCGGRCSFEAKLFGPILVRQRSEDVREEDGEWKNIIKIQKAPKSLKAPLPPYDTLWGSEMKSFPKSDIFMPNNVKSYKRLQQLREGFKKNAAKVWSFTKRGGGGGVTEGNKKPNPFFGKVFFQWACRIILVPPKHVLHLVWSAYVLSTSIRTALKIARTAQILGKRRPVL